MKLLPPWILLSSVLLLCKYVQEQTQQTEPLTSEAGIYFDEVGMIYFYPTTWKVVSYINLQPTRYLWRKVKNHYKSVVEYCKNLEKKDMVSLYRL